MATIGAANDPLSFVLTIPDESTPAVPFSGLFTPFGNSVLDALVRLKKQVQSVQGFGDKITAVPGWQILFQALTVYGENVAQMHLQLQKTGSSYPVPTDGNMANAIVANFKPGFEPQAECNFGGGDTGRTLSAYGLADGSIKLSAMNSGYDIKVGDNVSLVGMFILNNPVRSSI